MLVFFQTALLDSASVAGLRMTMPALATPLGGLATGIAMTRGTDLALVTQIGLIILFIGSIMTMKLAMDEPEWKYSACPIPGNFGQGIVYLSLLFSFIRSTTTDGEVLKRLFHTPRSLGLTVQSQIRSCRGYISHLSHTISGNHLGSVRHFNRRAKCVTWQTWQEGLEGAEAVRLPFSATLVYHVIITLTFDALYAIDHSKASTIYISN